MLCHKMTALMHILCLYEQGTYIADTKNVKNVKGIVGRFLKCHRICEKTATEDNLLPL